MFAGVRSRRVLTSLLTLLVVGLGWVAVRGADDPPELSSSPSPGRIATRRQIQPRRLSSCVGASKSDAAKSLSENRFSKGDSPILLGGTRKIGTVPNGFWIGFKGIYVATNASLSRSV